MTNMTVTMLPRRLTARRESPGGAGLHAGRFNFAQNNQPLNFPARASDVDAVCVTAQSVGIRSCGAGIRRVGQCWRAKVYDADSGKFLGALRTRGAVNLRDAETHVTAVAALLFRMDPKAVLVRHLAQVSATPATREVEL